MNEYKINSLIEKLKNNPSNIRFIDLVKICEETKAQVTWFSRHLSKATQELIFKIIKTRKKVTKLNRCY